MNDLTCPHCLNHVPYGAKVCRGCQAELKYGPSVKMQLSVFVAAVVVGSIVGHVLPRSMSLIGWVSFIGVFFLLYKWMNRVHGDRVIFKRIYRT